MSAAENDMRDGLRSGSWAPAITLSWLWGFAFAFSFQAAFEVGWRGVAAFAIPYSLGLFAFGSIVGGKRRKAPDVFKALQSRFLGLFLASQTLIVAAAIFATTAYLYIPLFGPSAVAIVALLVLLAAASGHSSSLQNLKALHVAGFALGVAATAVLVIGLMLAPPAAFGAGRTASVSGGGLVIPAFMGLMLGPWADVRQWQAATAIHREAGSIRVAYGFGAVFFLVLIALNFCIAYLASFHGGIATAEGGTAAGSFVARAVLDTGSSTLKGAMAICGGVALVVTVASSYAATSSLLKAATASSASPLLAFLPSGLVTSPLWFLLSALLVAGCAFAAPAQGFWLVLPFATLFVGPSACLICEAIGGEPRYDGVLCGMIGAASLLIFVIGYVGALPPFMALSPLIGLIGAASAIQAVFRKKAEAGKPAIDSTAALPLQTIDIAASATVMSHGFDGQWFVLHITPTYDDTNSVGNIYFANYFRWVGKARELFFNACMPDFDLTASDFLVLTKSFVHEFRKEMREFQPLLVRVRIGSYNRKFVTIQHEIHGNAGEMVGRGEQTIMFVDTVRHRPIDIPAIILQRFLPYYVPNNTTASRPGPVGGISHVV